MNKEELAKYLARELFSVGDAIGDKDESGDKVQRIEFKGGDWPDEETSLGGMCESALVTLFKNRLPDSLFPQSKGE